MLSRDESYYTVIDYEGDSTEVVIPATYRGLPVRSIADRAFSSNTSVVSVYISENINEISASALGFCFSLERYEVSSKNETFTAIDGNLYTKDGKSLVRYAIGKKETSVILPEGVTRISAYSFLASRNLLRIVLPDSVSEIEAAAFSGCVNLVSVTFGRSLSVCYADAFRNCEKLIEIINHLRRTISASSIGLSRIAEIHDGASRLVSENGYLFCTHGNTNYLMGYDGAAPAVLVLPEHFNRESYVLHPYAFGYATEITSAVIPDGVTAIGDCAFYGSESLTDVHMGSGVTTVGASAFEGCTSLTGIHIGDAVTSIGERAFYGCKSLADVHVGSGVKLIDSEAFVGAESLTTLFLGASLEEIGNQAFYDCGNPRYVYFEGTQEDFLAIESDETNTCFNENSLYYYSETRPETGGRYWHYGENGEPKPWS